MTVRHLQSLRRVQVTGEARGRAQRGAGARRATAAGTDRLSPLPPQLRSAWTPTS